MKYRQFDDTSFRVSVLGFGCMRFPKDPNTGEVDEQEAIRMLRYAIDQGVNYVDTAYGYHGGESERIVGRALKEGYREKVKLATKMPVPRVKEAADFDRLCNEQLAKLQDNCIDFYLLHGLNKDRWRRVRDMGVLDWAERAIQEGRIGALGFSFHGTYEEFEEIVCDWDYWALAQVQYNYMNENVQAGTKGVELAAGRNIPVVVMEPLLGGNLVAPPRAIQQLWDSAPVQRSPAEWALQWLWNKPEVTLVLSGMSSMAQVEENLEIADRSDINGLSQGELEVIENVRQVYEKLRPIPCTACGYCMPCPYGVHIPRNLGMYNTGYIYNKMAEQRARYARLKEGTRAADCVQCKQCEEYCPQQIQISEWMPCIHNELSTSV